MGRLGSLPIQRSTPSAEPRGLQNRQQVGDLVQRRGTCSTLQTPDDSGQSRSGTTRPQDCDLPAAYSTSMVRPSSQDIAAPSHLVSGPQQRGASEHPSSRPSLDQHCLSTPNSGTFSARRGPFVSQIGPRLRIGPEMVVWLLSRRDSWLTTPNSPGLFDLHQLSVEMEEGRTHDRERTPSVTGRDSHDTTTHWLLTTTRPHAVRQDTGQDPAREPARRSL